MSHTTTLKGVKIMDRKAIEQAVTDLKAAGVKVELKLNAVPRMYYDHQQAEVGKCDYVLHLPQSRYDVGLKWNEKAKEFDVIFDEFMGDVRNQIGAACPLDNQDRKAEHAIGRFSQRYGVNAAKNMARSQGYFPVEKTAADGTVHLEIAL